MKPRSSTASWTMDTAMPYYPHGGAPWDLTFKWLTGKPVSWVPPPHPPVPSSPRLQHCGFTVHGSAQTRYEDAWSFMFVLKVLTWHPASPWGPGEPVGGSVPVLTAEGCSLARCWYSEPGGPCVVGGGERETGPQQHLLPLHG